MLLYNRRGSITGEKIGDALGILHGRRVEDIYGEDWLNADDRSYLIRWGNSSQQEIDDASDFVINSSEAIQLATNKLESLEALMEAGIEVPAFSTEPMELVEQLGYPILGRRLRHARGSDIQLCLQERDFRRRRDFYTAYIPTNREYRVHVVGNNVVRIQGKYLDHPELKKPWLRNYQTGYRFRNPRRRVRSERLQAAIRAVSTLGLHFGAVDLIIGDDGMTYILEVNTAPSCSPLTGAAYVHGIAGLLSEHEVNAEINLSALDLLNPSEDEDSQDYDDEDLDEYEMEENVLSTSS